MTIQTAWPETEPAAETNRAAAPALVSVIVPLYNEAESAGQLYRELDEALGDWEHPYELVLVNDGSADGTGQIIDELSELDPHVVALHLRRNFGQTAAMMAGIDLQRRRHPGHAGRRPAKRPGGHPGVGPAADGGLRRRQRLAPQPAGPGTVPRAPVEVRQLADPPHLRASVCTTSAVRSKPIAATSFRTCGCTARCTASCPSTSRSRAEPSRRWS